MKRQKNFRLSESTIEKLTYLRQRYGTETVAVELAIDRLWQAEKRITLSKNPGQGMGATQIILKRRKAKWHTKGQK